MAFLYPKWHFPSENKRHWFSPITKSSRFHFTKETSVFSSKLFPNIRRRRLWGLLFRTDIPSIWCPWIPGGLPWDRGRDGLGLFLRNRIRIEYIYLIMAVACVTSRNFCKNEWECSFSFSWENQVLHRLQILQILIRLIQQW